MREALAGDDPFDAVVRHAAGAGDVEDVARTAYADLKTYLADDILVKVDRMSMAVSLEARVPYLDHRIVEFALSLPPELKLRGLATKVLLKKAFWDDLPAAVQRRGKEGFSIPIKNWIRGELRPMMLDLLSAERLERQGFFRPDFVARRVREHLEGRENHSHLLWALMVFEQWLDTTGTG
jgi:asparagine synthase (glutamine-hydrolysing)